jgi:hypothetical protein
MKLWPNIRDILLFLGGAGFAINEIFLEPKADPQVLILAAGMMGLPGVLRADKKAEGP